MSRYNQQHGIYQKEGVFLIPGFLPFSDTAILKNKATTLIQQRSEHHIYREKDILRTVAIDINQDDSSFYKLAIHSDLVNLVYKLLGQPHYLFQLKINPNSPLNKSNYDWHQDFKYWHEYDGMAKPNAVNIAILLEDVIELNGPTVFIPRTHFHGITLHNDVENNNNKQNLNGNLPYFISDEVAELSKEQHGLVYGMGQAGTLIAFHPNIYHKAINNLSNSNRLVIFITYVGQSTQFFPITNARPLWIANVNNLSKLPILGENT